MWWYSDEYAFDNKFHSQPRARAECDGDTNINKYICTYPLLSFMYNHYIQVKVQNSLGLFTMVHAFFLYPHEVYL